MLAGSAKSSRNPKIDPKFAPESVSIVSIHNVNSLMKSIFSSSVLTDWFTITFHSQNPLLMVVGPVGAGKVRVLINLYSSFKL